MREIISVDPFKCRLWNEHVRLYECVTPENCQAEIHSFSDHGQLIPTLARPLQNDPQYQVEIICGARRLFVARLLRKPLVVELREMSDREAIIALNMENQQRRGLSAYDLGCCYQSWLRGRYFDSQEQMARALGVTQAQVSRLVKLAQLPPVLVNAFERPDHVCETWGLELYESWQDPVKRRGLLRRARALVNLTPRPPPLKVYQELINGSARARSSGKRTRDEIVTDLHGVPAFRIRFQPRTIALLFPTETIPSDALPQIISLVKSALQPTIPQASVFKRHLARSLTDLDSTLPGAPG